MSKLNILVSGSGIAGSVFVFWLLRAYPDANITIIERAPSLRLTGASVDIRSSAVDIIKWMGAEEEIRKNSTNEKGIQFVNPDDKPVATLDATGSTEYQSITSEYEIFRGTLAKIFIQPSLDRVKLILDEYVESFENCSNGVEVTFAKSRDVKTYDLLVAADGLRSKIRGSILGAPPHEQFYDEGVHVCYFTIKSDMLKGSKLAKYYNTTRGRCSLLRPDPHPAGRTSALLMNVTTPGDKDMKKRLNDAIREGNESYKALMEELFCDAGWLAPEIIEGMRKSDDFYCSPFAQVRSPKIHDGRVVLLGDAGYATPGFGTSLAIIGGYVLAGELMNHPDDIDTALERYEQLVLPFAERSQGGNSASTAMQYLNPQTQWGITIRNALLGFVTGSRLDQLAMAVSAKLGFKDKKLDMPDYQWPSL